jgi:hypothetical protein
MDLVETVVHQSMEKEIKEDHSESSKTFTLDIEHKKVDHPAH